MTQTGPDEDPVTPGWSDPRPETPDGTVDAHTEEIPVIRAVAPPHLCPQDGQRVAVLGDLSGHAEALRAELRRLGAAGDGRLPPDLVAVQVGDLVHRGPDSDELVALVEDYLAEQPDQWVQLVGNHEALYLGYASFQWPQRISSRAQRSLRRWWRSGTMLGAVAVHTPTEDLLITHAGVTAGFWRTYLGSCTDVFDAADQLNTLATADPAAFHRPGHLLTGGPADHTAGPLWAASATELVPSWSTVRLPFSQVHGHSSLVDWSGDELRPRAPIDHPLRIDPVAKHTEVALAGGRIVGIDPEHGHHHARQRWQAWVIDTGPSGSR